MTLDEAIKHCEDIISSNSCKECVLEHRQLLDWLKELVQARKEISYYKNSLNGVSVQEIKRTIARNCVAWDTSKDKSEGLLPKVAFFTNPYLYKRLVGEEYIKSKAIKKFNIV